MRTFITSAVMAIAFAQESTLKESEVVFELPGTSYTQKTEIKIRAGSVTGDDSDARIWTETNVYNVNGTWATNNLIQMWTSWKGFSDDGLTYQYHVQNIQVTSTGAGTASNSVSCGTETGLTPGAGYSNTRGTTTAGCTDPWWLTEGTRAAFTGTDVAEFEAWRNFSYSTAHIIKM